MKKFAMMEQMAAANVKNKKKKELTSADKAEMSDSDEERNEAEAKSEALSEQQLAELFNETSYYSINSLQRNNDIMFTKQTVDEDGFVVGIDDPDYEKLMFEVDYNAAESDLINWMETNEDDYIGEEEFFGDDAEDADDKEPTVRKSRKGTSRGMGVKKQRFAGHAIGSSSLRRVDDGKGTLDKVRLCHEPCYTKV